MQNSQSFYIDGQWIKSSTDNKLNVINPANEEIICEISLGNETDLEKSVVAAKKAFISFSEYSREKKITIFDNIIAVYKKRMGDLSNAVTLEMGAPKSLSEKAQAPSGLGHFMQMRKVLETFAFENEVNSSIRLWYPFGTT